ncbi:MAG TPA: calcium-binding protein [Tepidisphaeraceae bacterium]|jgi:hypothetical protein
MRNKRLPQSQSNRARNPFNTRRRKKSPHNSSLEALEVRQLLSAAILGGDGVLAVQGTAGNDQITIARDSGNSSQIRVTVNATSSDFPASRVDVVKVDAGRGNDRVTADTSKGDMTAGMYFLGGAGSDTLVTATKNDALFGGGENDVLIAKAGNNVVNGGDGNDKLFAGTGNDTLVGEGGTDTITDAGGKNTIVGESRGDVVTTAPLPTSIPTAVGNPSSPSAATPTPVPVPAPTPTPPVVNPTPVGQNASNPFVIGVWSQPTYSFDKWKSRGINTLVGYEGLSGTVSVDTFSAEAVKRGMYMIRQPNAANPAKDKTQKNLLAWMLNDEPDFHNTPFATVVNQYKSLKSVDPNRPVFVNFSGSSVLWHYGNFGESDYKKYLAGADWVSNDLYPMNAHNRPTALDAPGKAVETLANWSGGKRQFAVIEASDQQLAGREHDYPGVTADQFRAEVFNAIISGATGIIYFPQRIGDGFSFDAMNSSVEGEMKKTNARISRIGAALMSQKDPGGVSVDVDGSLRVTWRKYNGKTYVVVLNNSTQAVSARMDIKGVSASSASVDSENRTVAIKNGQIGDSFKPYEAHVYVI